MSKKKIIVIISSIIIVILVIGAICISRNFFTIKGLKKKINQYVPNTNYHVSGIRKDENGLITTFDYYIKDNKMAYFIEYNNNGTITKHSSYNNGNGVNVYSETPEGKVAILGIKNFVGEPKIIDYFDNITVDETTTLFKLSCKAKIEKVDYKGKECYLIRNFGFEESEIYADKDTGLLLKSVEESATVEKEYEFDNVDDRIFVEPDISQYTIQN